MTCHCVLDENSSGKSYEEDQSVDYESNAASSVKKCATTTSITNYEQPASTTSTQYKPTATASPIKKHEQYTGTTPKEHKETADSQAKDYKPPVPAIDTITVTDDEYTAISVDSGSRDYQQKASRDKIHVAETKSAIAANLPSVQNAQMTSSKLASVGSEFNLACSASNVDKSQSKDCSTESYKSEGTKPGSAHNTDFGCLRSDKGAGVLPGEPVSYQGIYA